MRAVSSRVWSVTSLRKQRHRCLIDPRTINSRLHFACRMCLLLTFRTTRSTRLFAQMMRRAGCHDSSWAFQELSGARPHGQSRQLRFKWWTHKFVEAEFTPIRCHVLPGNPRNRGVKRPWNENVRWSNDPSSGSLWLQEETSANLLGTGRSSSAA